MPIKGDINTLAGIGMTNNRVWWQKKGGERKNRSEVYSGQRLMKTSWIATITFFSTRGRCFTKAIAHSKAIERDIILLIVEIKKKLLLLVLKKGP